jgi:hypothetical protein
MIWTQNIGLLKELSMEVIATNPDANHLKLIIWLLVGVLGVLTLIIGYFITFGMGSLKSTLETLSTTFSQSLKHMSETITELKVAITGLKTQVETEAPHVTKRLDTHSFILTKHEGRLKVLETEHNMIHKVKCIKEDSEYEKEV